MVGERRRREGDMGERREEKFIGRKMLKHV